MSRRTKPRRVTTISHTALRRIRKAAGFSVVGLAAALDISPNRIYKFEIGLDCPPLERIIGFAPHFGRTPGQLLDELLVEN